MTQYLLSVHDTHGAPAPEPAVMQAMFADVDAFNKEVQASGEWVFAGGLEPPETATVVRIADGEVVLTDGPFAETREHLGGFWVIETSDLDAALALADRAARACRNPVEARPFQSE